MLGWFQALMPKEAKFFDLFESHAAILVEGATALRAVLEGGNDLVEKSARVAELEDKADAIARDVMLAVRRTFITPFDRGDIQNLISSMDDSIDQMKKTTKAIKLFEVVEFDPIMREMGDVVIKAAKLTVRLVDALRDMRKERVLLNSLTEEMIRLEELSDRLHDRGIKELFLAHRNSGSMKYIVGAEIYEHLEHIVDRFEDVANRINGILIEHV
jgi:hypothetical protein